MTPPNNLSAVSLTPANSLSAVSLTPAKNFRPFSYFLPVWTTPGKNCSPVSTTPPINCSPVSTTPPINFSTSNKLYWRQKSVLSAKLSPAAEAGHGRRYCLRGLWSRCLGCSWMQFFIEVPMTPAAGDIADLSPSIFSYPWQLPTSMASLFLWPTINLSPMSLSPAIIVHRCCLSPVTMTPVITENPWQGLNAGVTETGDKFLAGVVDTAEQFIAGVNDIYSWISPQIFEKIQKGPNGILGGLGDTDSWKKPEVKNLVSDSL